MSEKEIAMNIVFKMLELKMISFGTPSNKPEDNNQKHLETICDAYRTVYQTIKQCN